MNRIISDLRRRTRAMPYRANWYDDEATIGNVFQSGLSATGDLNLVMSGAGGAMRFLRPFKGDLVEARLTMQGVAPTQVPTQMRFYKGDYDTDGITAITSYTEARIASDHKLLTGLDVPISLSTEEVILIDGLDISKIIPKRGDADFNEDGFILGVELIGTAPGEIIVSQFKIDCTVNIAESVS